MLINQLLQYINKPIVVLFIVILFCIGYFLYTSLVGDIQTNFFLFGPVKDENDNYLPFINTTKLNIYCNVEYHKVNLTGGQIAHSYNLLANKNPPINNLY